MCGPTNYCSNAVTRYQEMLLRALGLTETRPKVLLWWKRGENHLLLLVATCIDIIQFRYWRLSLLAWSVTLIFVELANNAEDSSGLGCLFSIPVVNFAANTGAPERASLYPFALEMIPSDALQARALVAVLNHFNWKRIGILGLLHDEGSLVLLDLRKSNSMLTLTIVCVCVVVLFARTCSDFLDHCHVDWVRSFGYYSALHTIFFTWVRTPNHNYNRSKIQARTLFY